MAKVVVENLYKSFPSRGESSRVVNPTIEENIAIPTTETKRHKFNQVNVLRSINLTVDDGEFLCHLRHDIIIV